MHGLLRYFWLWCLLLNSSTRFLFFFCFFRFCNLALFSWRKYGIFLLLLFGCARMSGLWQLTPWPLFVGLLDVVCILTRAQRVLWTMCSRSARLFLLDERLNNFYITVRRKILLYELLFPWLSLDLRIMSQLNDFINKLIFVYVLKFVTITHLLNLLLDVFFKIVRKFLEHFSIAS